MDPNKTAVGVIGALVVGLLALLGWQHANPTPTPAPTTTTTLSTTSTSVADSSTTSTIYQPPVVDGWFDVPVYGIPVNERSDDWVDRLWRHADNYGGRWRVEFGTDVESNNYGVPVYYTDDATMEVTARRANEALWPGIWNIDTNETIPWNPNWRPAAGKDGFMHVIDRNTGKAWGFWNVSWWSYQTADNNNLQCDPVWGGVARNLPPLWIMGKNYGGVGYDPSTQLCAASAFVVKDPAGKPVDIRSWKGNFPGGSGGGWYVMPITPQEVKAGKITHAFHMLVYNTLDGPLCTPEQRKDPEALGNVCGDAVAPAGQLEGINRTMEPEVLQTQVPEGMRFSLNPAVVTDEYIGRWLDQRGFTGAKRRTARILAEAARDYGWFIGDSTNGGAGFSAASVENPADAALWKELGIDKADGDDSDILRGLFTADNIVAYEPPWNQCRDGSWSKFFCWATTVRYTR